jgi:hypothetical protein
MDNHNKSSDLAELSRLNAQFISNFVKQDTAAHNKIIHKDFVCIASSGAVASRDNYMKDWAHGYTTAGYKTFEFTVGNTALVRSKTLYTKEVNGEIIKGASVYTDTYVKENGKWLCVQAQITPVK